MSSASGWRPKHCLPCATYWTTPGVTSTCGTTPAIALGKIAAQPRSSEADVDRAVTSLVNALKSGDGTLPSSAAEALGRTGDSRAIHPLAEFLNDRSPSVYAREEAVRAIGKIGGNKARAALEKAHTTCQDEQLVMTINSVLRNLNQTSKR